MKFWAYPLPVTGFHIFSCYLRYFLTPLSYLTWANLMHTLCGVANDPFFANFNLGYTYYFWADFYLLGGCYTTLIVNFALCCILKVLVGKIFPDKKVAAQKETDAKKNE